jgi:putative N6-adenine-specific DNA methylase
VPGAAGLVVTNPPYGVRLGEEAQLGALYAQLGDVLRRRFLGWTAFVLAGNSALAKRIGLRSTRRVPLWNGTIECRLLEFPISADPVREASGPRWRQE